MGCEVDGSDLLLGLASGRDGDVEAFMGSVRVASIAYAIGSSSEMTK